MLHEPNSDTLANSVAERIYSDILSAGLREGDFFMTGDAVAERYGVSRTVAREALGQLRGLGVLKSRQKRGLLVARPDPVKLASHWVPLYCPASDPSAFRTLAQLRYALELGAVDLAISHAPEEAIARLAVTAAEFDRLASRGGHTHEADVVDLMFHKLILEMTGNPLIAGMHRVLSDYFHASAMLDPLEDASKAIRDHYMVVDALRARDRDLTRALLRAHLERTIH